MATSKHRKRTKQRRAICQSPEERARAEAQFKIMETLKGGAKMSGIDLLNSTGLSKITAVDAMKGLLKRGQVEIVDVLWIKRKERASESRI
jgi:hypothetical protein